METSLPSNETLSAASYKSALAQEQRSTPAESDLSRCQRSHSPKRVEPPIEFYFSISWGMAGELGLPLLPSLLAHTDDVIE